MSFPSPDTRAVSHHAFKNRVYNKTRRASHSPSGAIYLIAWGKQLQHVPQIRSCLFPRSHSSGPVLSVFPPAATPPFNRQKKKRDVPVFTHFNMPDHMLSVASLAVAIGRDWQSWGCKVRIAPDTSGSQTGTIWMKHEKNGG